MLLNKEKYSIARFQNNKSTIMKQIVILVIAIISTLGLFAQNSKTVSITGTIVEKGSDETLIGATIIANNGTGTISNYNGKFQLEVPANSTVLLKISFVGYNTVKKEVTTLNANISMGNLFIEQGLHLDEVVVKGEIAIATQKGDTVSFNANAVKVNEEAKGVDIVKKLPGFKLTEDKIETQGEQVKKIYINGKPFFEDDPKNALNSLPAEIIKSIEVFDDYGEIASFMGYASGSSTKAINIVTNDKAKNNTITSISTGYGTNGKFDSEATILYNKNKHDITIVADYNNVNKSRNDLSSFKSFETIIASKLGVSQSSHANPGEQLNKSIGLNYNYNGTKGKLNVEYKFGERQNDLYQDGISNYQNLWYYNSLDTIKSNSLLHKINTKYIYENNKSKLILSEKLLYLSGDASSSSLLTGSKSDVPYYTNSSSLISDKQQLNSQSSAIWLHKLNDKGRALSAIGTLNLQNSQLNKKFSSHNRLLTTNDTLNLALTNSVEQQEEIDSDMNKAMVRLSYKEPISLLSNLNFTYGSSYNWNNSKMEVSDFNNYYQPNLSNKSNVDYRTNKIEIGYSSFGMRLIINAGLAAEQLKMTTALGDNYNNNKNYYYLHPLIFGRYDISTKSKLTFLFRSFSTTPSVSQLQPTVDITNPEKAVIGNPDLTPGVQYMGVLRYVKTLSSKAKYLSAYSFANYTTNFIGFENAFLDEDKIIHGTYLNAGANTFTYSNLGNSFNLKSGIDYAMPVSWLRSNLNLGLNYNYSHTPTRFNEIDANTKLYKTEALVSLSSKISKKVDFFISNENSYNYSNNDINNNYNEYYSNITEATIYLKFLKTFSFETELNNYVYNYFGKTDNQQYLLWDFSIGKSFLKNKANIKLSVHDIFNQSKLVEIKLNEIYSEVINSNSLSQYALLSFTYKF